MKFIRWLKNLIVCDHEWEFIRTVDDIDLRSGVWYSSAVKRCKKCERYRTFVL